MMPTFGPVYEESRDGERLRAQRERIRNYMLAASIRNEWLTLEQISAGLETIHDATFPPASVSAQLRHLRNPAHGGYTLKKRYVGRGLWEYRMFAPVKLQGTLLEIGAQHYREDVRR